LAIEDQSAVKAYHAKQGDDLGRIESLECVAGVLPDGSLLGVGQETENNLVRRQPDGTTQTVWPQFPGSPLAMSSDGRFLVTYYPFAYRDQERDMFFDRVEVWDTTTKKSLYAEEGVKPRKLAFSPDGTRLLLRDSRHAIKRLDLIQLAGGGNNEDENNTPNPADEAKLLAPTRTWTDRSGKFQIEAALVSAEEAAVLLKTSEGKQIRVPLVVLSEADRQFLKELAERN